MAEFDELSVRVAAQTQDFNRGMDSAERSLNAFDRAALEAAATADIAGDNIEDLSREAIQTAGAMQVLGGRTDNAGDQLSQTAVQAGTASAGLNSVSTSANAASVSSLNLSSVLVASVAPALAVVAAAAVPVVAALGGLITVAGSILGIGLIGAIGAIATNAEQLKEELNTLLQTIGTEFSFAIEQATAVLSIWIGEIQDIIPELVPAEQTITEIASLFDQLGTAVIETLPAFVDLAVTLTREFLPGMIRLAQDVLPRVPGFLRNLVGVFRRLIPSFQRAGRLLVNLGPELLQFGFTALNVVGPALVRLTSGLTNALRVFNQLDANVQTLAARFATIAPVIAGIATLLGGPLTLGLASVVGGLVAFRRAWQTNFANIRTVINGFRSEFQSILPAIEQSLSTFLAGVNVDSLVASFSEFEQVAGTQLLEAFQALKPVFSDVEELLRTNQEEIRIFGEAAGTALRGVIELASIFAQVIGFVFTETTVPAIRAGIDVLDVFLTRFANAIQLVGALSAGNLGEAAGLAEDIVLGEGNNLNIAQQAQQQQQQRFAESRRLIVGVETDSEMFEAEVRDVSQQEFNRRARRSTRLQDRGTR